MAAVRRTLLIEAPPRAVFDLVSSRLYQQQTSGPVRSAGGVARWKADLVASTPGESLELALAGPADGLLIVTFAPVFNGCTWVTWTIEFPDGAALPEGQLEAIARTVWERASQLRDFIEAEGPRAFLPAGQAGGSRTAESRRF